MSVPHDSFTKTGGKFDFKDGGTYIGEWCDGRANGVGIATGPNSQGEYSGDWSVGFENCGVYIWPTGNVYEGLWMKGKRHGEGVQITGRWLYRGCFTAGYFGRYGVKSSLYSQSRYEGCWLLNEFDGYGIETCSDGSSYSGFWLKSQRKGLGVSRSAFFGQADDCRDVRDSRPSTSDLTTVTHDRMSNRSSVGEDVLVNEIRNGFVLCHQKHKMMRKGGIIEAVRKFSLKRPSFDKEKPLVSTNTNTSFNIPKDLISRFWKHKVFQRYSRSLSRPRSVDHGHHESVKPDLESSIVDAYQPMKSVYDPVLSSPSSMHGAGSNSLSSAIIGDEMLSLIPKDAVESYAGQWEGNLRCGLGVAERTDGLKYIGQWRKNKRDGCGVTCFPDDTIEEGRYVDNVLVQSLNRRGRMFLTKNSRLKNLVDDAIQNALDIAQDAKIQAAEIAYKKLGLHYISHGYRYKTLGNIEIHQGYYYLVDLVRSLNKLIKAVKVHPVM